MKDVKSITVMSSKGQVVIPAVVRAALGLREGHQFEIGIKGNCLVLRSVSKDHPDWRTMEGMFGPVKETTAELLAEARRAERKKDRKRCAG